MSVKLPFTFYLCKHLDQLETFKEHRVAISIAGEYRTMYSSVYGVGLKMKLADMVTHCNDLSIEVV